MQLEMDITTRCNIRCRMCYFSFDRYFFGKPVYFPLAEFERLAADVFPHVRTLTLSLGSEPLTSPHFPSFLALAAASGVPEVSFHTNGLLMGPKIIDAILASSVTHITISVDGASRETYEGIRVGADFATLITNVRALVAARTAAGRAHPVLRFGIVMMRANAHEWADIVSFAAACGVEEVSLFHMVAYEGLGMEAESLVHDRPRSNAALQAALERAEATGVRVVSHPGFFGDAQDPPEVPGAASEIPPPFLPTPYCHYPFFHVSMNSGGHVLPCPFSHGEGPYGTVSETESLTDIWLGPKFEALRRRILDHDPPPMCRRCSYLASHYPNHTELFAPRRAG